MPAGAIGPVEVIDQQEDRDFPRDLLEQSRVAKPNLVLIRGPVAVSCGKRFFAVRVQGPADRIRLLRCRSKLPQKLGPDLERRAGDLASSAFRSDHAVPASRGAGLSEESRLSDAALPLDDEDDLRRLAVSFRKPFDPRLDEGHLAGAARQWELCQGRNRFRSPARGRQVQGSGPFENELAGLRRPTSRVEDEKPIYGRREPSPPRGKRLLEPRPGGGQMRSDDICRCGAVEWKAVFEKLKENHSQRIEVRTSVRRLALEDFRGSVGERARRSISFSLADRMGQPKVQEHDLPFAADEDVGGLEVPVRDSPPVQKVQDGADMTERSKKPRRGGAAQGSEKCASIHALVAGHRCP